MRYESYQELIGNTPLVRISRFDIPEGTKLYAKLELANPGGSVKDRIGRAMIDDAERRGALKKGGTVVEGTAGNTGIGIAFAALGRGYRVIFVVPDKFSGEKVALLRALGAEIVRTPRAGGMLLAEKTADEIAAAMPGAVVLGQFHNPANPRANYETTGPEIWRDMDGQIDAFDRRVRRGRGLGRNLQRRRTLPQGEEPCDPRHPCGPRRVHDGRRRACGLQHRGNRKRLHPRHDGHLARGRGS